MILGVQRYYQFSRNSDEQYESKVTASQSVFVNVFLVGFCIPSWRLDSCLWSKTLSKKEIASDEHGRLIMLKLLGGSSQNDDNQKKPKIKWNKSPHNVYIFCSKKLPAVMMESGGDLQVDVLDFWQGIPAVYESSANLYRETCHSGSGNLSDEELAKKFKYSPSPESDITISKPTEIFGYIKKQ